MAIKLIKENEKGKTYSCNGFKLLYRSKASISGDNEMNTEENIYLVSGKAVVVIGENSSNYTAPATFSIPEKTYHKIEAVTDITMILFEE